MKLVDKNITVNELKEMSEKMYGLIVKAVVDIEKEIMVVDAQMHADEEVYMLEELDCQQHNLWGINLDPVQCGTDGFIIFDSMINIRPAEGNRSRNIENPLICKVIRKIVMTLVTQ